MWGFLAGVWGALFLTVSPAWRTARYYEYGYLVPVLVVFLLLQRRREFRGLTWRRVPLHGWIGLVVLCTALSALGFLTFGISDWRIAFVVQALLTAAVSFWVVGLAGSLSRARALAGIVLLGLTAVPWPVVVESHVVDQFTTWVVDLNVAVLPYLGVPAAKLGNIILAGEHRVEVAEACSGIKSLQMLLTAAFFLGEFARMTLGRRALLLAAALPVAFFFNTLRSMLLAFGSFAYGSSWYESWHDPLGYLSFCFSGATLLFLGDRLQPDRIWSARGRAGETLTPHARTGLRRWWPVLPVGWALCLALAALASRSENWLRSDPVFASRVRLPAEWESEWMPMSNEANEQLSCLDSQVRSFFLPGGKCEVYFLEWNNLFTGYRDVTLHRPDICMGHYGGAEELAEPDLRELRSAAGEMQVFSFRRSPGNGAMRVYRILGTIGEDGELVLGDWALTTSAESVARLSRRRMLELALDKESLRERFFMILIGVEGNVTEGEADQLVERIFLQAQSSLRDAV